MRLAQHLGCALADVLDLTAEGLEELRACPHPSQDASRLGRQLPHRRENPFIFTPKRPATGEGDECACGWKRADG